ncbi:MAG TPA: VOC family protein [Xanthobacteraceae bacterium]|nr:VOC family protein [Xanthobacteraceae bacterium]
MKAINHLVLAGHDLESMRSHYARLGFTVTPRGQHPFGTGNSLIQLHGTYLEPLAVTVPRDVPEHRAGHFSFAAFNRDYLARHQGFSMLVLDTSDARADIEAWRAAGLQTYAPFDFSRTAKMPDGEEITVGFSLAFVSHPAAPWLGLFACQHYSPQYFEQPRYLQHANGAMRVQDVWIVGETALDLAGFLHTVTGAKPVNDDSSATTLQTRSGAIVLARPQAFERVFGLSAPHQEDGPHLAALTVACQTIGQLADLPRAGNRHILAPEKNFGTAIGFVTTKR